MLSPPPYSTLLQWLTVATKVAYHTAKYLHRDVSTGNVMIDQNGRGILNDWDHSVKVPRSGNRHAYRTVSGLGI